MGNSQCPAKKNDISSKVKNKQAEHLHVKNWTCRMCLVCSSQCQKHKTLQSQQWQQSCLHPEMMDCCTLHSFCICWKANSTKESHKMPTLAGIGQNSLTKNGIEWTQNSKHFIVATKPTSSSKNACFPVRRSLDHADKLDFAETNFLFPFCTLMSTFKAWLCEQIEPWRMMQTPPFHDKTCMFWIVSIVALQNVFTTNAAHLVWLHWNIMLLVALLCQKNWCMFFHDMTMQQWKCQIQNELLATKWE